MSRTSCRAARLVQILSLLRDRPRTAVELAEMCGVTPRTIRRDLLELQMEPLRVPLVRVPGGRWGLMDETGLEMSGMGRAGRNR